MVQELGLQGRYNDDEFAMYVRMVMALAFVPLPDLENTFDDLCTDFRNQFNNDMDGLLDYFEDTRRPTVFTWNVEYVSQNSGWIAMDD